MILAPLRGRREASPVSEAPALPDAVDAPALLVIAAMVGAWRNGRPWCGTLELARLTGLPAGTVNRALEALLARGYFVGFDVGRAPAGTWERRLEHARRWRDRMR